MNTASLEQQFMPKTPHVSVTLQTHPPLRSRKGKGKGNGKRWRSVCVCDCLWPPDESAWKPLLSIDLNVDWGVMICLEASERYQRTGTGPLFGSSGGSHNFVYLERNFSRFSVAMSSQSQSQTDIVIEVMIWYDEVYMLVMSTLGNCKKWQSFPNIINRRAYFSSFFSW